MGWANNDLPNLPNDETIDSTTANVFSKFDQGKEAPLSEGLSIGKRINNLKNQISLSLLVPPVRQS